MGNPNGIKYICDFCGQLIEIGRPRFILKGELYGAYDGAEFDETLLPPSTNIQEEIKRLIAETEKKSEKELNDEVYYAFNADLCRACRDKIYSILDEGRFG